MTTLWGSHARMLLSGIATAALAYGAYFMAIFLGRDWPSDAFIPLALTPATMMLLAVVVWLSHWLFVTPYDQWTCLESRLAAVEEKLSPRFEIFPFVGRKPERVSYGTTHISMTGKRQSVIQSMGSAEFLTIPVENVRSVTLKACEAYLTNFQSADPDAENSFWEPVRLSWLPMSADVATTDVPSHGQRSLILFKVVGNRAHLVEANNAIPIQMVHAIADKGDYYGHVTISGHDAIATHIAFELHCDAPGEAPTITVMRRGLEDGSEQNGWARERPFLT